MVHGTIYSHQGQSASARLCHCPGSGCKRAGKCDYPFKRIAQTQYTNRNAVEVSPLLPDHEQPYNHMCVSDLPSQRGSLWRKLDGIEDISSRRGLNLLLADSCRARGSKGN
jgi:hypothetical protein